VHVGNNLDILPSLPDNSVDSIVTDPPYELGFMGKKWDSSGIAYSVELWKECLRVLKPGGHLLSFGGTRTWHRVAVAIEDAGFDVRDSIAWMYGSGFPKSLNLKDEWEGWGTALKPAFEPIVVARKPLIGTVAENVLTYGTGALNIDGSRVEGNKPSVPQPKFGVTKAVYEFGSGEGRNGQMSDNTQGRWPANVILDEYSAELLDEQSGTSKSAIRPPTGKAILDTKAGWNQNSMSDKTTRGFSDSGGASRFFYVAKASKRDRNEGLEGFPETSAADMVDREEDSAGMNSPRAGAGRTSGAKNFHPTVKPTELMKYLIKLVTPPNGTVLDPFTGSGSTGKAALLEGFRFIGIEMTEDYVPIIEGRLKNAEEKIDEGLF
jgi:site-specific DNA-methyltransferase (adenine-specific)